MNRRPPIGSPLALLGITLTVAAAVPAEEPRPGPPDKSGYHLLNPTPERLMRPIEGDRPDGTESPRTVDAGHLQVETSILGYGRDETGLDTERWAVLEETNFRVGLTNRTELQTIISPYTKVDTELPGGGTSTAEGFGDVTLRLKHNFWGNDAGRTAFGVMPFVKIPTGTELSNDHVEGGMLAMYGIEMAENWGLGFQVEPAVAYDGAEGDHDFELGHTAVLGFDVFGPVGAYVEYLGRVSTETDNGYEAQFSTGMTWAVTEDLVLDGGARIGLTDAAQDLELFSGITMRF